jgi:Zn-dependent protease
LLDVFILQGSFNTMIRKRMLYIAIMFFAAGSWGIAVGAFTHALFILYLAIINIVLGIFFMIYYRKSKKGKVN